MKKVFEIFNPHRYAIIWTVCYIAAMWAILYWLFSFDMFSIRYWQHLLRAELRGFPGFVFGILVLAALPLYIATTLLIVRTKKPLLSVPIPEIIKKFWARMQPTLINPPAPETKEKEEEKEPTTPEKPLDELPPELPYELRTAYVRARLHTTPEQHSVFNQPIITTPLPVAQPIETTPASEIQEIPLPSDFNTELTTEPDFMMDEFLQSAAPTFTDITFGTPEKNDDPISEHLNKIGKKFNRIEEIIITDKHAIATHNDDDFWVCDNQFWFATGKQKESPIIKLTNIASQRGLTPVLYLGSDNIMDLDTMRQSWESSGITIITTPEELSE